MGAKETIIEHKQKYGVAWMINIFGSIIPIVMFMVYMGTQISALATDEEVLMIMREHESGLHPRAASAASVEAIQEQLVEIQLSQMDEKIRQLLRVVCEKPELYGQLEPTIRQAISDYEKKAGDGTTYQQPTCIALGVIP